ncbi:FAD-dependent oxidoreductase [Altererythrobacter sp. Root672]|uniref:FAD-dependent oxidoreductase n=1 Tax=Altererythrobacter sp. Root672 TaxID=1736584 RepID=UPI0006FB34C7|nr:FAD-dependent oxidoreductase [Altererythrobacter sp. Root672]KRA82643.1 oxidoreductase [Altererythrobacter sp. Root672]
MIDKALVVGGGVGGMSAALALARQGVEVELVDADPHWRAYGAGISVTGLSLRAFDDLGILEEVRGRGFVGGGIRLRTADGSVIMESPPIPDTAPPIARSGGIMRPALHEIMSRKVRDAGIRVTLGAEITSVEQYAAGAHVGFPDGRRESYDLVVAADGIFSQLRRQTFPDASAPQFTGQGCWRIVAQRPPEVDRPEMFLGGPVKLGFNPISDDRMYAFILEHVPDNPWFAPEEQLDHVAGLLAPFGGYVPQVRAALGSDSLVNYRPLEWLLLPAPWHRGRVVLIGDAVHATTPHMASGAGMAVEDGLVLAEEIARHDDLETALTAFTARRFERARMVVENSVRVGEIEMSGGDQRDANAMLGSTMQKLHEPY